MRNIILFILLIFSGYSYSQHDKNDTLVERLQVYEGVNVSNTFNLDYQITLRRAKRVYPLALEAARIIDSIEMEIDNSKNKREVRKIRKNTKKTVKEDFKFLLKDLYVSEGKVLTKLVYRETGMTVNEIIKKYGNNFQAVFYSGMAGLFEQDLNATYSPEGEDFVLECVVRDLISGKVPFDSELKTMDKQEYKESMKSYRQSKRESSKKLKARRKQYKKQKKLEKKSK